MCSAQAEPPGPVVVLGATGYIGSALVARLARRGVAVRAVGRRTPTVRAARVETVTGDATDPDTLSRVVADAATVVHLLAALTPGRSWRVEDDDTDGRAVTVGSVRTLTDVLAHAAARRAGPPPAVVTAGTTAVVGTGGPVRIDGSEPDAPETGYDAQKLAVEGVLAEGAAAGALRPVRLRLPTVYGTGTGTGADPAAGPPSPGTGVVAAMARRAVAGLPLTLWHDGSVVRDLLHVDDVARAIERSLWHVDALGRRSWPIGTGHGVPLGEVVHGVADRVAARTGRPPVPVTRVQPPDYARPTDFHGMEVDASGFAAVTGWRPVVDLADGLDGVVDAALVAARSAATSPTGPAR